MLDNSLRGVKEYLLLPAAIGIGQTIHPITITLIALGMGLISVLLLSHQYYFWGLIFWLLNRLLDGLDGTVARENHLQTDLGGYLDIVFDFIIYALVPIALVYADPSLTHYLLLGLLLASFYINAASWMYLSAILEKRAQGSRVKAELTSVTMPAGLIGGAETVLFYCAFIIWPQYLAWLFALMSLLVLVTISQRVGWAIQRL